MSPSTTATSPTALAAEWAAHSYRFLDQTITSEAAFEGISDMYATARRMQAHERQAFWAQTCELLGQRLGINMPSSLSSMPMTPPQVADLSDDLSRLIHGSVARRSHPATVLLLAILPIRASFTDFENRRLGSTQKSPNFDSGEIPDDLSVTFARWR